VFFFFFLGEFLLQESSATHIRDFRAKKCTEVTRFQGKQIWNCHI
jgi:hypothetical protein